MKMCSECKGVGQAIKDGHYITCPACNGDGRDPAVIKAEADKKAKTAAKKSKEPKE